MLVVREERDVELKLYEAVEMMQAESKSRLGGPEQSFSRICIGLASWVFRQCLPSFSTRSGLEIKCQASIASYALLEAPNLGP